MGCGLGRGGKGRGPRQYGFRFPPSRERADILEEWLQLFHGFGDEPDGWSFHEVAAVGVDRHDNVYVFNRGEHPMIVFDRDGNFLRSWGEGVFPRAHGLYMAPDDTVWLTDDGDHSVRQCTLDGKVLMALDGEAMRLRHRMVHNGAAVATLVLVATLGALALAAIVASVVGRVRRRGRSGREPIAGPAVGIASRTRGEP